MLKKITFMLDSGSDYEPIYNSLFDFPVRVIPLFVYIDDKEYLDSVTLSKNEFYNKMVASKKLPKTSQPTPTQFYDAYIEEIGKGHEILVLSLSSKLSGTYQSATIGRAMLDDKDQDKVYIVDSLNVSAMIILLLLRANQLLKDKKSLQEVVKDLEQFREKISFFALLDTLENLKKGGRISATKAAVGGMLSIKPLVTINDGSMESLESFRGRNKGLQSLATRLEGVLDSVDKDAIFIINNYDDRAQLDLDVSSFPLVDFKNVHYITIGPTIGTYAGPNVLGFGYVEK